MDDGELRYWAERGRTLGPETPLLEPGAPGDVVGPIWAETKQLWRIVGELAHRVLELKEERDGS